VEVHNDYFLSVRNGSGANPTMFGSLAVDTIGVGGTVTWNWAGQGHNVTPTGNSAFVASGTQSAPFTFGPVTFNMPGTYGYRCTNHSRVVDFFGLIGMRGEIVVR
jgi:plastocyanin